MNQLLPACNLFLFSFPPVSEHVLRGPAKKMGLLKKHSSQGCGKLHAPQLHFYQRMHLSFVRFAAQPAFTLLYSSATFCSCSQ